MSKIEDLLAFHLDAIGLEPVREYRFAALTVGSGAGVRKRLSDAGLKDWRFDYAFPAHKLAVEVEGGGWTGGRHTRGKGFADDLWKYHKAMDMGWVVYRCDGAMVRSGAAVALIEKLLKIRGG